MPLYTDPGSRTAHVWGHLSSYFRFKYFVSTEGKQLLQGTLKNMQGDHHTRKMASMENMKKDKEKLHKRYN